MTFGLIFWILMLIWLVFSLYPVGPGWTNTVLLFILFLLLGWKVFGAPVHG